MDTYMPSNGVMIICINDTGDFVKKSDAQAALAEKDQRIEQLVEALISVKGGIVLMVPEPQKSGFVKIIDAALAPQSAEGTEGV